MIRVLQTTLSGHMVQPRCIKLNCQIQQRTGHRSLDGLRRYEHNSVAQLVDISNVLSNDPTPAPVVQQSSQICSTSAVTESPTSIVFRGCTFTECAISMSGQATNMTMTLRSYSKD